MGAFEQEDHGWLFGIVGGIIALVFAGIIVSLLIDNRTASTDGDVLRLEVEIARQEAKLEDLEIRRETLVRQLEERLEASDHDARLAELSGIRTERRQQRRAAENAISEARETIEKLQTASRDYRIRYHERAREELVGETFDSFTLVDGTSYSKVKITGHDDEGLRIRHAHGGAKLRYTDLPQDWKERLQWSPLLQVADSPSERTVEERTPDSRRSHPSPESGNGRELEKASVEEDVELQQRIHDARSRVIRYRADYLEASREASIARSKSYSSERSVPGSLETWQERALRMDRAASQARRLYLEARSDLARDSPGDPLLRDQNR